MTLAARLRALLDALPPDGSVTLSRAALEEWLSASGEVDETHDLSVAEVAARVGRSTNSVRRWLSEGRLRGYRVGGRDWRVPPEALAEFRRGEASPPSRTDDLSAWRRVRPRRP